MDNKSVPSRLDETRPAFLDLGDRALLAQCEVDVYRASGPGGQKRNKIESAVRLRHRPTALMAKAEESRSQHENKARALQRLRRTIALQLRRQVDADEYEPSGLLRTCVSRSKKLSVGRRDRRYHAAVWEILDVLHACGMRLSSAAGLLGVSTANLGKFLRADSVLWRRVNEMRTEAGLKTLK